MVLTCKHEMDEKNSDQSQDDSCEHNLYGKGAGERRSELEIRVILVPVREIN